MNINLKKAKEILLKNNYTCVLLNESDIYYSNQRGVKPLIDFYNMRYNFSDYCAADKVVGAGAAHIYTLLGVTSVWACVISTEAKDILIRNDISVFFEQEVPYIINRSGDGICPIEACVKGITHSGDALIAIKQKLKELS